jgi:hypothetical protein
MEHELVARLLAERVRDVFSQRAAPDGSSPAMPTRVRPATLLRDGFEEGPWSDVDNRSQDAPHGGRYAAELGSPGPASVERMRSATFPLPEYGLVEVSAWTHAIEIPGPPAGIVLESLDSSGTHLGWHDVKKIRAAETEWTYHTQTFPHTLWPAGAAAGRLHVMWLGDADGVGGRLKVDDVQVSVYWTYYPWASTATYYE